MLYPVELQAPCPAERVPQTCIAGLKLGRGRGIRTPDPLLPKQMRYQTAPCPDVSRPLCTGDYYSCPLIEPQDNTGALNSSQFESIPGFNELPPLATALHFRQRPDSGCCLHPASGMFPACLRARLR